MKLIFCATFLSIAFNILIFYSIAQCSFLSSEITVISISEKCVSKDLIGTNLHAGYEKDILFKHRKNNFLQISANKEISFNSEFIYTCKNVDFKLLRFPGGNLSDYYHWGDAIGPFSRRHSSKDEYGRSFLNYFGPIEFAKIAETLQTDMMITVNYKTGSAQEAANWVEYCNAQAPEGSPNWVQDIFSTKAVAPKGYFAWLRSKHGLQQPMRAKYWEVGNEILFHKDKRYINKAIEYSKLMKAIDKTIKVGLVCESFININSNEIKNTAIPLNYFDFLILHYYSKAKYRKPITKYYRNAESTRTFNSAAGDFQEIVIEASGSKAINWPRMELYLNGGLIKTFIVDSTSLTEYKTQAGVRSGMNTLAIRFANDTHVPGVGDCNLFVKSVRFRGHGTDPMEVWNTQNLEYAWLFANNRLVEEHISLIRQIFPNMDLAITEGNAGYGINPGNMDKRESRKLKAGLWIAGLLNSLIRQDVPIFAQWGLCDSHMGFGLVYPDGHVSPSYYVMRMYAAHAGQQKVDLAVNSPTFDTPLLETTDFGKATTGNPYIDAVASYNPHRQELVITAINRHEEARIQTDLHMGPFKNVDQVVTLEVLNANDDAGMEASNEQDPNNVIVRSRTFKTIDQVDGLMVLNAADDAGMNAIDQDTDNVTEQGQTSRMHNGIITLSLEPHSLTTIRCLVRR